MIFKNLSNINTSYSLGALENNTKKYRYIICAPEMMHNGKLVSVSSKTVKHDIQLNLQNLEWRLRFRQKGA